MAIQVNELRVGNYLSYASVPDRVNAINSEDNYVDLDGNGRTSLYDDDVCPIPLTPEVLEAVGFDGREDEEDNPYWYYPTAEAPIVEFSAAVCHEAETLHITYPVMAEQRMKYVHQLQNLYFALTGQELTVHLKQPA